MKTPKIPDKVGGVPLWQIIVFGIIAWFAYPFIKGKLNQRKAMVDTNEFEEAQHEVPAANPSNPTAEGNVTINTKATANEIYDAFYNADPFGITEDEGRAIQAILKVPANLIPEVSMYYSRITPSHGRSMIADFQRFLNPFQLQFVKDHFGI